MNRAKGCIGSHGADVSQELLRTHLDMADCSALSFYHCLECPKLASVCQSGNMLYAHYMRVDIFGSYMPAIDSRIQAWMGAHTLAISHS